MLLSRARTRKDLLSKQARVPENHRSFSPSIIICILPLVLLFCSISRTEKPSVLGCVCPTSGDRSTLIYVASYARFVMLLQITRCSEEENNITMVRRARVMDGYRFCLGLLDVWLPSDNYSWNCLSRRAAIIDTRGTIDMRRHSRVAVYGPAAAGPFCVRYLVDSNYGADEMIPMHARVVLRKIDIDFSLDVVIFGYSGHIG